MKNALIRVALVLLLSCSAVANLQAAPNKAIELSADTIEYDSTKGIMIAQGNIQIVQENATMSGDYAEYNSKANETYVNGNARIVKDDTILVARQINSYGNTRIVANGDPILTKGNSKLMGPSIDYDSVKQYAIVTGWANLAMDDSIMTANQIESFFLDNRVVAQGNVHLVSSARNLDATSEQAVYYGTQGEQGKTILTGNVRAVQEGNVLTGNTMTLYLDKKTIDVQGRSKLIIIPQS
ncbi:LptA/OstA family protein [Pelosinus sp. sgz500959]|uniref:LptA/OstA family protein n=1 Tax=Pelosinus sp. sgz500959 TaxID=3242472 RepID=UPI00366ABAB5